MNQSFDSLTLKIPNMIVGGFFLNVFFQMSIKTQNFLKKREKTSVMNTFIELNSVLTCKIGVRQELKLFLGF